MSLEISRARHRFGAWKLLVSRFRAEQPDGGVIESANTTAVVAALVGAYPPRSGTQRAQVVGRVAPEPNAR
ncbi:hypothetical protein D3C86_1945670 [compost metagenome]|jgi:hypothetical protein